MIYVYIAEHRYMTDEHKSDSYSKYIDLMMCIVYCIDILFKNKRNYLSVTSKVFTFRMCKLFCCKTIGFFVCLSIKETMGSNSPLQRTGTGFVAHINALSTANAVQPLIYFVIGLTAEPNKKH